jgi:hypothetical protein
MHKLREYHVYAYTQHILDIYDQFVMLVRSCSWLQASISVRFLANRLDSFCRLIEARASVDERG